MESSSNSMLESLAVILGLLLTVYLWMVVIRAIISWVNPSPRNPLVRFLIRTTDPPLNYIRRTLPVWQGGVDLSPVVLILLIVFGNDFLVLSLKAMAKGASVNALLPIFFFSLARLVKSALYFYLIVIIIRAVLSWVSPDPYNIIVRLIYGLTEPVLGRVRRALPLVFSGFDLSPLVVIAVIYLAMALLDQVMRAAQGLVY